MSWWSQRRRERLLRRAPPGPVRQLLECPWPSGSEPALEVPALAVDFETTGLDPKVDTIVSVAWVAIDRGRIELGSATRYVVRPESDLPPSSVRVHGIGHDRAARGRAAFGVLEELLARLRGRVLVAHHAALDVRFLAAACRRHYQAELALPCIDTLTLARTMRERRQRPIPPDGLRLAALRDEYGLPRYPPHDALWDAVGAAELWLALAADWAAGGRLPLRRVRTVLP